MELVLNRIQLDPDVTIGELLIDNEFECWICEDVVRPADAPKVHGKTAIPYGRYRIIVNPSNRFKRLLPLLLNVPNFEGIRIHPGNTAEDTEGCLLPGRKRLLKSVGESRLAFDILFQKIQRELGANKKVFINIHKAAQ